MAWQHKETSREIPGYSCLVDPTQHQNKGLVAKLDPECISFVNYTLLEFINTFIAMCMPSLAKIPTIKYLPTQHLQPLLQLILRNAYAGPAPRDQKAAHVQGRRNWPLEHLVVLFVVPLGWRATVRPSESLSNLLCRKLDNPELSADGKDINPFLGKTSPAFPLGPGMPKANFHPPSVS